MAEATRLIKKHANRRLYDTESKKYVSIEKIRDVICDGIDVRVEDAKTREDITRSVLLQIMAECEQDGRPMLSPTMLMTLIRNYGSPMQEFVGPFLERSLAFYTRQESRMRRRMQSLIPDSGAEDPVSNEGKASLTAMRDMLMQILKSGKSD